MDRDADNEKGGNCLSMKTEYMQEMSNECNKDIVVVAATNRVEVLDPAFRRRFTKIVAVSVLNSEERRKFMESYLNDRQETFKIDSSELDALVERTERFSCADIADLFQTAAMNRKGMVIEEAIKSGGEAAAEMLSPADTIVDANFVEEALKSFRANITEEERQRHDELAATYQKL